MPITPPEPVPQKGIAAKKHKRLVLCLFVAITLGFLALQRGLLVAFLGLKILGYSSALDAWKGPVQYQSVLHSGIPIDIYGEDTSSPFLIVHGVNPSGKDSPDLIRISQALAQVGYQVFVPDLLEMKRQHLRPEEAVRIKEAFQFIGKDAAIACFSYGCGPALVAAADPEINRKVRFALAFGGYFDSREALEFTVTGPKSPMVYLKWVYLGANSDLVDSEIDQAGLQAIAVQQGNDPNSPLDAQLTEKLSPEGKALLEIFTASTPDIFRERLNKGPEALQRRLDSLSPSKVVQHLRAPLILVHGMNDPAIPAEQAVKFAAAVRANGLDCSLTLLRMYGHVHPILPALGFESVFGFYGPETLRFLKVVNRVVGLR